MRHSVAFVVLCVVAVFAWTVWPPRAVGQPTSLAASIGSGDATARGIAVLERLDPGAADRIAADYGRTSPAFARDVIGHAFGDVHADAALDPRTRMLTAVAALVAVGDSEVPLGTHLRYALASGCTRPELIEVIRQTHVYAGMPRTVKALAVAERAFAEMDKAPR